MSETMTMTATDVPVSVAKRPANTRPFVIQFFLVQGINFRCVAYCDPQGRWRDAFNQEELFGDIQILSCP